MKRLSLLALLGLAACANPQDSSNEAKYPSHEIIEMEMNGKVVYGVLVKDSTNTTGVKGYELTLSLGDKAWQDTLILELTRNEAIQGEVIFSDAIVDDMGGASVEMSRFDIK